MHEDIFQSELEKDERVQWTGQPDPNTWLGRYDRPIFFMGILCCVVAVVFAVTIALGVLTQTVKESSQQPPLAFLALPVLFPFGFGMYFSFGRLQMRRRRKRKTFYAITNKRVLIAYNGKGLQTKAIYLDSLPVIEKFVKNGGKGSLYFGELDPKAVMGAEFLFGSVQIMAFEEIPDVDKVYRTIGEQRQQRK